MPDTTENLKAAFAGESQASRKYAAFARKAEVEGYPQVAKLFRAAAMAETVHAYNHLKALGGIQSTGDNLRAAIAGENYEVAEMYPGFISTAEAEENKKARTSFFWAMEVEKVHAALYQKALEGLSSPAEEGEIYVCPVCGYTHEGAPPEKCPVCGTPGKRFELVE
jgi:rubrerythrin